MRSVGSHSTSGREKKGTKNGKIYFSTNLHNLICPGLTAAMFKVPFEPMLRDARLVQTLVGQEFLGSVCVGC